ncbi:MAG: rhomboid family intramembrane serine protease [Acidobacteria bacterium]|nr:rhomboid family intramembrane serine protease [Acidobacteriota bacterium]MBV9476980.1 rhomboid family intramembrane serine protease [Acidobacteriota bacterium]
MIPLRDNNPRRTVPIVNYLIIGANVLMFLWELSLGGALDQAVFNVAFIPARFWLPGNWVADLFTIVISMFLHGGLLHIAGNMLYLWIFGDNVEDRIGHVRYFLFYFACGFGATYAHALFSPASRLPAIGASGAIAGVLGAYLILYPHARVTTLIPIFIFITIRELPAILILGFWFILQLFSGVGSLGVPDAQDVGGTAYFAHIGGFVIGMLLIAPFGGFTRSRRRQPPPPWWAQR